MLLHFFTSCAYRCWTADTYARTGNLSLAVWKKERPWGICLSITDILSRFCCMALRPLHSRK